MQAALRAAVESLDMCGEGEREPPHGVLTMPLMRHQRLALDWMLRREAPRARPVGGILADDQACSPRLRAAPVHAVPVTMTHSGGDTDFGGLRGWQASFACCLCG